MHGHRMRERLFRPITVRKHRGGGASEAPKIDTRTAEWDEFYRSQSAYLRKMAVAMRLAPDQTEDVIQDVWLATLKNLHQFIGENALRRVRVWMRGVMRRKTANSFRRRRFVSLDDLATEPMASTGTEIEVERRAWLAARLDEMEADEAPNARLFCGHCRDGRTIADLAMETGLTEKAICHRIYRQIEKLRQTMQEAGLADPDAS
jgi:RNA polymerase sigma factor (sigma-70 family)